MWITEKKTGIPEPGVGVNGATLVVNCDEKGNVIGASGLGTLTLVPAASLNGTPLGVMPEGAVGVRLYLAGSDSITFTIADSQPGAPPAVTYTLSMNGTGPNWDENLSSGQMIYITAVSGSPKFRWF